MVRMPFQSGPGAPTSPVDLDPVSGDGPALTPDNDNVPDPPEPSPTPTGGLQDPVTTGPTNDGGTGGGGGGPEAGDGPAVTPDNDNVPDPPEPSPTPTGGLQDPVTTGPSSGGGGGGSGGGGGGNNSGGNNGGPSGGDGGTNQTATERYDPCTGEPLNAAARRANPDGIDVPACDPTNSGPDTGPNTPDTPTPGDDGPPDSLGGDGIPTPGGGLSSLATVAVAIGAIVALGGGR